MIDNNDIYTDRDDNEYFFDKDSEYVMIEN